MQPHERIIVALDVNDVYKAFGLVDQLEPHVGGFKMGIQFIYSIMRDVVQRNNTNLNHVANLIERMKGKLFLDVKIDDIDKTLGRAAKEIAEINPMVFNVMASAGVDGLRAVVANKGDSKVWVVTVLTSLGEEETQLTFGALSQAKVLQFARNAKLAQADGIICSPLEVSMLKKHKELSGLTFATPGIRPTWAAPAGQTRYTTPTMAIQMGVDFQIIGDPLLNPPPEIGTPEDAAKRIGEEIAEAIAEREAQEKKST